jgi:hypothetical protein
MDFFCVKLSGSTKSPKRFLTGMGDCRDASVSGRCIYDMLVFRGDHGPLGAASEQGEGCLPQEPHEAEQAPEVWLWVGSAREK